MLFYRRESVKKFITMAGFPPSSTSAGFSFGASTTAGGGFSFGQQTASSQLGTAGTNIAAAKPLASTTAGFSFAPVATTKAGGFSFGATNTVQPFAASKIATAPPSLTQPQATALTGGINFSQAASTAPSLFNINSQKTAVASTLANNPSLQFNINKTIAAASSAPSFSFSSGAGALPSTNILSTSAIPSTSTSILPTPTPSTASFGFKMTTPAAVSSSVKASVAPTGFSLTTKATTTVASTFTSATAPVKQMSYKVGIFNCEMNKTCDCLHKALNNYLIWLVYYLI